jgi:hypothetical protein
LHRSNLTLTAGDQWTDWPRRIVCDAGENGF